MGRLTNFVPLEKRSTQTLFSYFKLFVIPFYIAVRFSWPLTILLFNRVRIKKRQFSSTPLIGSHYGDIFIGNKELVRDYAGIYSGETLGIGLADDDGQDDEQEQQVDEQAKEGNVDDCIFISLLYSAHL